MNNTEFWTLYLQEHSHPWTRWLHAIGTLSSLGMLFSAWYFANWWLVLVAPAIGYGMAWSSHALIERNRPLSMRYPVRSFLADFRLTFKMLLFRPLGLNKDGGEPKGRLP